MINELIPRLMPHTAQLAIARTGHGRSVHGGNADLYHHLNHLDKFAWIGDSRFSAGPSARLYPNTAYNGSWLMRMNSIRKCIGLDGIGTAEQNVFMTV